MAEELKDRRIYTVSEITRDIKMILENTFADVWVEGEVSGISRISTGTTFFSLKDSAGLLKCVIFPSHVAGIKFQLKDGLKVICRGHISVYEKSGQYQLYTENIEPKGLGSLQLALEQLKEKLEKEGLFSPAHKRPLPYLPSKIGIITSLSGAAIKDILKVLDRRFKDARIIIRSAQVQGEGAKEDIARAIEEMNVYNQQLPVRERLEVMIVGRGGGSIEDLWAFNEEIVARAIYNSHIPVISAVGHERDYTIADLVADLRAPTPSVAAEIVLPNKEDLKNNTEVLTQRLIKTAADVILDNAQNLEEYLYRLKLNITHLWQIGSQRWDAAMGKLARVNPAILIPEYKIKITDLAKQISVRMSHFLEIREMDFSAAVEKLSSLNPLSILSRGYSVTFKAAGNEIIKDAAGVKPGDVIKTRLARGGIISTVSAVE